MKNSSETRKHRGFSEESWVGVEHQVRSDVGACELMQTHLSAGHCRWIGRPGGKRPGIVCEEAIRRDLSVYLPVNAVATVPEIYDDPHYGTRSGPSRFKAPKTLEIPGHHVG